MKAGAKPAVFLDRDGVLNYAVVRDGVPTPPRAPEEVRVVAGAARTCDALRSAGFALVVVTNQPDIARGNSTLEEVEAINRAVGVAVGVQDFRVCPHDDADGCGCRKPKPGLLLAAAESLNLDLAASWLVGDRWRDVEAGRAAGCRTVFINYGYLEKQPSAPDYVVTSTVAAGRVILDVLH